MNDKELWRNAEGYGSYLEVLVKAILLDKVKIVDGRIIVETFDD